MTKDKITHSVDERTQTWQTSYRDQKQKIFNFQMFWKTFTVWTAACEWVTYDIRAYIWRYENSSASAALVEKWNWRLANRNVGRSPVVSARMPVVVTVAAVVSPMQTTCSFFWQHSFVSISVLLFGYKLHLLFDSGFATYAYVLQTANAVKWFALDPISLGVFIGFSAKDK